MKVLILTLIGTVFISYNVTAQGNTLIKIQEADIYTSDDIYVNEKGDYFAKTFYIAFQHHIIEDIFQSKNISSLNIQAKFSSLKNLFSELEAKHGLVDMKREYPDAIPEDTIRYSKKGKPVIVTDLSKRYKLVFSTLQSYQKIKKLFSDKSVEYIEPPEIIQTTSNSPNDQYYDLQWSLKLLEADKVFEITKGSTDIILGINDRWTNDSSGGVQEELQGKIIAAKDDRKYVPGADNNFSHGPRVAAIAAAKTNNEIGVASLGGNFNIVTSYMGDSGLAYMRDLPVNLLPDVINMSWTSSVQSSKSIVKDLLSMGVVMVGASVNTLTVRDKFGNPDPWPGQSIWGEPFVPYPASFNYPDSAFQVISVTATQLTDDVGNFDVSQPINPFSHEERFRFQNYGQPDAWIYNYGLSNNPISNPTEAFTDVAAPSARMLRAKAEYTNDYVMTWGATSEAAPLVTSLVGLLLSVNPDLGVREVYDIITSSTKYNNIVVPPGTTTYNHPDGIRKYNKYVGYGRIDAYKAVVAAVPKKNGTINSATTWSGYVHLENTVNVYADLTIRPGTTVLLDDNVSLNIRAGAKLIAEGTETEPIRFIRGDADNAWNAVNLMSSAGNSIKWALFDGGYINLSIASKNNTIEHSTFKNATFRTMQGWHNQDGTGNASATISHSLIENSASVGIVAQYLDLNLNNTTIKNNNQDGIYVHSSTIFPFYQNLVTNNGVAISSRDGVRITSSGTFYMLGAAHDEGYNEISDNAHNQIENYGDTIVGAALGGGGGYNSVKGIYSGSHYLVANYGSPVNSVATWWGQSSTDPAMFTGTVSGWNLSSDPTTNPGNNGASPAKAVFKEKIDFDQLFDDVEQTLSEAETQEKLRSTLHQLYQIEGLANNPALTERFLELTDIANQSKNVTFNNQTLRTTFKDEKLILFPKVLIRNERYEDAQTYLNQIDSQELSENNRLAYLELRLVTETYHGAYKSALSFLDEIYALRQTKGASLEEAQSLYTPIREDIVARLKTNERSAQKETSTEEQLTDQIDDFGLHQNYPNPFNPITNISFTLPESGFVRLKVYDVLGREVANLVNEVKTTGTHSVNFDASSLSSGIYMYKLEMGQKVLSKRMTLIK